MPATPYPVTHTHPLEWGATQPHDDHCDGLYTAFPTSQTPTGGYSGPKPIRAGIWSPHISDQEGGSIGPIWGA